MVKKKSTSNWLKKKAKSKVVSLKKAKSNQTNADQPSGHKWSQPCHQGDVAALAFSNQI